MSTEKKHYELSSDEQVLIDNLRSKSRADAQAQLDVAKGIVDIDEIKPGMSAETRARVAAEIAKHWNQ